MLGRGSMWLVQYQDPWGYLNMAGSNGILMGVQPRTFESSTGACTNGACVCMCDLELVGRLGSCTGPHAHNAVIMHPRRAVSVLFQLGHPAGQWDRHAP